MAAPFQLMGLAGIELTARTLLAWPLIMAAPVVLLGAVVYWMISLPLRRKERARFFLDLIQSALDQGQSVETYLVEFSRAGDPAPGAQLHLVAARVEQGMPLIEALERTPGCLPPQMVAMLKAGQEAGNVGSTLPACRRLLDDAVSQSRATINYQMMFALFLNPAVMLIAPFIQMKVVPVFQEIFISCGPEPPAYFEAFIRAIPYFAAAQLILAVVVYLAAAYLLGGARFASWVESGLPAFSDHIYARVPWRRLRLQRDFAAMLGLLLDGGASEEKAVSLAAASAANRVFERRGAEMIRRLKNGVRLPEAIQAVDRSGEVRWRLENAARRDGGFDRALAGWRDSLDARAFKKEQAAAQTLSFLLLAINGLMALLLAAGVFASLAAITAIGLNPM